MTIRLFADCSPRLLLLSHERSGTHFMLYCISEIFEKQPVYCCKTGCFIGVIFRNYFEKNNGDYVYSSHAPANFDITNDDDILILILRNYRETHLRSRPIYKDVIERVKAENNLINIDCSKEEAFSFDKHFYIGNLRCFDMWNPEKRFLVYYEDLIDNPEEVLSNLVRFMGAHDKKDRLRDFLGNYQWHKNKSLKISFKNPGTCQSKGLDHLFHSKKIGFTKCKFLDNQMKNFFPFYYEKYLKRYDLLNRRELYWARK